jgi:hypothetical protein
MGVRRSSSLRNTLLLAVAMLLCTIGSSLNCDGSAKSAKPELLRITSYPSGLSAGGASIDLRSGMMECCTRSVRIPGPQPKADCDPVADRPSDVYRVFARLGKRELADLESLVVNAGLHDFVRLNDDLRCRKPARDECAPTLVIVWNDTTQVLTLPLTGTVEKDTPAASRRAHQSMADICRRVCVLENAHARKPCIFPRFVSPVRAIRERNRPGLVGARGHALYNPARHSIMCV